MVVRFHLFTYLPFFFVFKEIREQVFWFEINEEEKVNIFSLVLKKK